MESWTSPSETIMKDTSPGRRSCRTRSCSNGTGRTDRSFEGPHGKDTPSFRDYLSVAAVAGALWCVMPAAGVSTPSMIVTGRDGRACPPPRAPPSGAISLTAPSSLRLLEVVEPKQIEIALEAFEELERRQETVDNQWRMKLEEQHTRRNLAQRPV